MYNTNEFYIAENARRLERWQRLESDPELAVIAKMVYRKDIDFMIRQWGITIDPRNVDDDRMIRMPFLPFQRQTELLNWFSTSLKNKDNGTCAKSRDMGASWLSVAFAVCYCTLFDDITIGFGSRKAEYVDKNGAPKALLNKAREFIIGLPKCLRAGYVRQTCSSYMRISFPETNSQIVGESGDAIGRGDRTTMYFVDESAHLERPKLSIASLSATTNCRIDISSANGLDNPFAENYLKGINTFRFHWTDDPHKNQAWYDKQCRILDSVTVAQEIDIDFNASCEGRLIPIQWINAAIDFHLREDLPHSLEGEAMAALDVADKGKDKNAVAGANGYVLEYLDQWSGRDVEDIAETAERAVDFCVEHNIDELRYDSDGVGSGINGNVRLLNIDRNLEIETTAYHGNSVIIDKDKEIFEGRTNGCFFISYSSQCWWFLRNLFKNTFDFVEHQKTINAYFEPGIYEKKSRFITEDINPFTDKYISISAKCCFLNELKNELSQITYSKKKGKVEIDKAPNDFKSPNLADSVKMVMSPTDVRNSIM